MRSLIKESMSETILKPIRWGRLLAAIVVCQGAGILGSLATVPNIDTWYRTLEKPGFTPPDGVFGPVWTTLYLMMGLALYRVWNRREETEGGLFRQAMAAFFVQLALNALWSILFFGLHSPWLGLIDIGLLWLAIIVTIRLFAAIDRPAAWLLVPYLLWVSYAAVLNAAIWRMN